jgi:hypothetical protein
MGYRGHESEWFIGSVYKLLFGTQPDSRLVITTGADCPKGDGSSMKDSRAD